MVSEARNSVIQKSCHNETIGGFVTRNMELLLSGNWPIGLTCFRRRVPISREDIFEESLRHKSLLKGKKVGKHVGKLAITCSRKCAIGLRGKISPFSAFIHVGWDVSRGSVFRWKAAIFSYCVCAYSWSSSSPYHVGTAAGKPNKKQALNSYKFMYVSPPAKPFLDK